NAGPRLRSGIREKVAEFVRIQCRQGTCDGTLTSFATIPLSRGLYPQRRRSGKVYDRSLSDWPSVADNVAAIACQHCLNRAGRQHFAEEFHMPIGKKRLCASEMDARYPR